MSFLAYFPATLSFQQLHRRETQGADRAEKLELADEKTSLRKGFISNRARTTSLLTGSRWAITIGQSPIVKPSVWALLREEDRYDFVKYS